MDSMYAEVVVKPKQPKLRNGIAVCVFLFAAFVFLLSCVTAYTYGDLYVIFCCLPFEIVVISLDIYFYRRGKIEYEYLYCDDVLLIAKIINKSKRKNMAKIETDNIELFAPVQSAELNQYKQLQVRDFASARKNNPVYVMVTVLRGKKVRVLLEPSEKLLSCLKIKLGTRFANQ